MKTLPYLLKSRLSNPEEIEKMEATYKSAKPVIQLIVQALEKELATTLVASDSEKLFEDPNWAYRNAYLAGFRQGLRTSRKIIIKE